MKNEKLFDLLFMSIILKLPASIERIERGDKVLFFNPEVPSWLVTNSNGALLLSLCDGNNSLDEILSSLLESNGREAYELGNAFFREAIGSKIFDVPVRGTVPIHEERQVLSSVQLSISSHCNLHCKYCYATDRKEGGEKGLTLNEYKRVIDEIVELSGDVEFTLTGGEPLLNKDVFSIARYIHDKGCLVDVLTNGTLISDKNIDDVKSSFDKVSISIDGSSAERHERFRGKGSYAKTIYAIELLRRHDIPYRLSMTVNRLNIGDVETMAKKYGSYMNFAPLFPAGDAKKSEEDLSITGMEYYKSLKSASGVNPLSYCDSTLSSSQECRRCKCAIGGSEISISPTGDVYPCQLLHYPEFLMGNVRDSGIDEILSTSDVVKRYSCMVVDNIEGCSTCFLRYVCGGACRARAYHECGDIFKSGSFCEYEREAFIDGIFSIYGNNVLEMRN